MASTARGIAFLLTMASLALIVVVTTMPWSTYYVGHSHWARVEWVPFSKTFRPLDLLLNILLFVPFGYSAFATLGSEAARSMGRRNQIGIVAAAFLLSLAVELFQVYCHARLPTMTDVISNTGGALLGARWAAGRAAPC
jgi:glycopeptide antibiotics resistance protein